MRIFTALALAFAAIASATSISYDPTYDQATNSLNEVSCSDGPNGLETKYGWQTFGDIPNFPYITGSDTIPGWNSNQCGQCFSVTYNGNTIYVLGIDHTDAGLNMAQAAMDSLTGGQAVALGRVDADVSAVDVSNCGLTPSKRSRVFRA
ncbi:hypothetical protein BAUCODRAFT_380412 [Baudoinia panamericana UAMH 10762]|uniref:Cerato-platanin n=1 Tax=Baudoinia panamericana (strain UAMH 10762) TaxID=717646 RepID=M2NHG5_BAUPA|nr:uncharacterized protein BAUCODRAFT_380412 [Baudoinia panamericana UAMH 10762]EMC98789.1 hypothetical protein BAUCODRAFT_380412 [Baudoinia panamericana UAMH 10762]